MRSQLRLVLGCNRIPFISSVSAQRKKFPVLPDCATYSTKSKYNIPKGLKRPRPQEITPSLLSAFAPEPENAKNVDYLAFLRRPWSLKYLRRVVDESKIMVYQSLIPERHEILGNNLASAHFIVHRGGSVKFIGQDRWIKRDEKGEYDLPTTFQSGWYLEAIDAAGLALNYDGLHNLKGLRHLKWLSLSKCPLIDDWCIDRISSQFAPSLENLDVSYCPLVTERSFSAFYRFECLKKLKVDGLHNSTRFELACLMLEEMRPELKIDGFVVQ